jgi:hypothetical protein
MSARNRQKTLRAFKSLSAYYMYSTMESIFTERNHPIAIRPCFDYLSRDRGGGSSVIGYHLPQSVSVLV